MLIGRPRFSALAAQQKSPAAISAAGRNSTHPISPLSQLQKGRKNKNTLPLRAPLFDWRDELWPHPDRRADLVVADIECDAANSAGLVAATGRHQIPDGRHQVLANSG